VSIVSAIARARDSGDFNAFVQAVPYAAFLGISVEEREGRLYGKMKFADHLVGNPTLPALHGGTLAALLECAAQFELIYRAETIVLPKTVTITVDYLRSAKPKDTFVRATIVRQGKRVTTVHAHAWQDDEAQPVAWATVHALIIGTP
jgi:uncharacterized protein (TIGR00369 family)